MKTWPIRHTYVLCDHHPLAALASNLMRKTSMIQFPPSGHLVRTVMSRGCRLRLRRHSLAMIHLVAPFLVAVSLAACSAADVTPWVEPRPSSSAIVPATATQPRDETQLPAEVQPVATATYTCEPSVLVPSRLPPGAYVLVMMAVPNQYTWSINVVHIQGQVIGCLASGSLTGASLSPDRRFLALREPTANVFDSLSTVRIVDLKASATVMTTPAAHFIDDYLDWSPDSQQLVMSTGTGISLLDLPTGRLSQILDCQMVLTDSDCYEATWSPDGRWIAFKLSVAGPEVPGEGIYLVDAQCIRELEGCEAQVRGPSTEVWGGITWSPDGRAIAGIGSDDEEAVILGVPELEVNRRYALPPTEDAEFPMPAFRLAWSPDGQSLAYVQNCAVRLLSLETGNVATLLDSDATCSADSVISWLTIPD